MPEREESEAEMAQAEFEKVATAVPVFHVVSNDPAREKGKKDYEA